MTFTYSIADLTTDLAKIRRLINDVVEAEAIFDDEEIEAFLVMESSRYRRAAALALETIAGSEAYTLKVMRRGDLQTDGTKTAEGLLKRAALLREQDDSVESESDAGFDIAEHVFDDFSARERIEKQALRGAL